MLKRSLVSVLLAAGLLLVGALPAAAIVHAVTPIGCNGAVAASGGGAGGFAALPVLLENPNITPPMPAQGLAHSAACED